MIGIDILSWYDWHEDMSDLHWNQKPKRLPTFRQSDGSKIYFLSCCCSSLWASGNLIRFVPTSGPHLRRWLLWVTGFLFPSWLCWPTRFTLVGAADPLAPLLLNVWTNNLIGSCSFSFFTKSVKLNTQDQLGVLKIFPFTRISNAGLWSKSVICQQFSPSFFSCVILLLFWRVPRKTCRKMSNRFVSGQNQKCRVFAYHLIFD